MPAGRPPGPPRRGRKRLFVFLLGAGSLAALAALAPPLSAQLWTGEVQAGRASFGTSPTLATSANLMGGLRYGLDDRFAWLSLAAPIEEDGMTWGAAGVGDRIALRRGRVELGLDLLAAGHLHRDPLLETTGGGARGDLLPILSLSVGPVITEARSGGAWYRTRSGDESWARALHVSDLGIRVPFRSGLGVGAETRHLRNRDEGYTFAGASASMGSARGSIGASVGEWIDGLPDGASTTEWSLGLSARITPRTTLRMNVRSEPFNPLHLSEDRTHWGIALGYRLGFSQPPPPSAGPDLRRSGRVVLRVPLLDAPAPPRVAGDFSGWETVPMHRKGDHWQAELDLEPGLYHYAFQAADGEWFVPPSVPNRRDDGMGGWVAVLLVPGAGHD